MFESDPFAEIQFDFVFGWYKKTSYDSWLELLKYGQENYEKKFKRKPNIGFVHVSSFIPDSWLVENVLVYRSKYCTRNVIFLGEVSDVLFQSLLERMEQNRIENETVSI